MSDPLAAHLARVAAEARRTGRPLLAAWRERAPGTLDPLACFAAAGTERCYWSVPAQGLAIAGEGAVAAVEAAGAARFADAAARARALFAGLRSGTEPGDGTAPAEASPLLLGAFAYGDEASTRAPRAGFPPLRFTLPERTFVRAGARAWRILCAQVGPADDPERIAARLRTPDPPARAPADPAGEDAAPGFAVRADRSPRAYRRGVATALAAIARGELEKVVLARACRVARRGRFDAARVLATLARQHPGCFVFGIGTGAACFVGASPERLVRRDALRVRVSALAGSAPRGRTPDEDAQLARTLRESKKEQAEHAVVRRAIAAALAPVCAELDVPEAPDLLRLDGVQHLHTAIEGRLQPGAPPDLLALAGRLHPTPAIGGAPRAAARAFLARHEALDRGLYGGGVGWLAAGGNGELAVALRCALLQGGRATLWAGAGVVEGSEPEAELAETRLKLRAALAALVEL